MKKFLVATAMTASLAGSAFAADLPARPAPMMAAAPVAIANWTGCYIGAGGGYGMFVQRHHTVTTIGGPLITADVDTGGKGWFGTVQGGCDYQFADRFVVGAFADYDFSGLRGNFAPAIGGFVGEERQKDTWAAGGRVGYAALPRLLAYVSGGYTETRFDGISFVNVVTGGATGITMNAQKYKGWFIGTGYEYGLDFFPGLYWKTEYRYASYRAEDVGINAVAGGPFAVAPGGGVIGFENSRKDVQTIRSELVYRFNFGGGPVVARY